MEGRLLQTSRMLRGDRKKWEEQLFLKEKLKIPEMHFQFKGIQ